MINRNDFAYAGREAVNTGIITFKRIAHSPFKTIANQTPFCLLRNFGRKNCNKAERKVKDDGSKD